MTSNRNIFNVSYPIFLTLAAQNIVNVTDTAFLGRVGEVELGASAIAGVFYIAIYIIGFGFSQGAQILIGRRNGEGHYAQIGPIFNNGLVFNLLLGVLMFALTKLFMPGLMARFVSSERIYHAAMEFLDWRIYGFFFSFLSVMFRALYVGTTRTRVLTLAAVITAGTNIVLDYLMIFGHAGFPVMGIRGAAIASVIAEAATLLFLVTYTLASRHSRAYGLFRFARIDLRTVGQTLELSVFIMFQNFISISTWFFFFIFIEHMGERPLAATNVGRSVYTLLMIPGSALGTTTNTLVSNLIGSGHRDYVLPFVGKMVRVAALTVLPVTVLSLVLPGWFARVYTDDPSLIAACVPVMRVVAVAIGVNALSNVTFNALSGTGNTRTAFLIEFAVLLFYVGYSYFTAIVHPTTVAVVWGAELIYWLPIGAVSYLYLLKGNWRKKEI